MTEELREAVTEIINDPPVWDGQRFVTLVHKMDLGNRPGRAKADAILALIDRRASNPSPEQDWVLVPREPTEAMQNAHFRAHAQAETVFADVPTIWAAMLAAAPPSPEQGLGSCSASPGVGENVPSAVVRDLVCELSHCAAQLAAGGPKRPGRSGDSVDRALQAGRAFLALSAAVSPTNAAEVHDHKASPEHAALVEEARELRMFLDGSGELEGVSFGDRPPISSSRGAFWWRKYLVRFDRLALALGSKDEGNA